MQALKNTFGKIFSKISGKNRIYLDYASITPVDPRVSKYMAQIQKAYPANPSSLYKEGVLAFKKLEEARGRIAKVLDAHADEIVFTSGGTESNNLAVKGILGSVLGSLDLSNFQSAGLSAVPHIVSTNIEHPSIRELLLHLEKEGTCTVTFVSVGEDGLIDPREIKKALRPETVLVSVMYVNNEIGTVQPISEIAKAIRAFKKEKKENKAGLSEVEVGNSPIFQNDAYPYFHTDACQAGSYLSLRVLSLGVEMMTLDGSKIYGPRSTGVLYTRRGIKLRAQVYGGDQEKDRRAGTENVATAQGFAYALELAQKEKDSESVRLAKLRDKMLADIQGYCPNVSINGDMKNRLPNNLNICLSGMDAEFAVLKLDVRGICVSSVTSCRSKKEDSYSYVIEAIGKGDCAKSSLRITLGRFTSAGDIARATKAVVEVLRSFSK